MTAAQIYAAVVSQLPGILTVLIASLPSLIVALTPYPKAQGFAQAVLKVLNVFSLLTHKDSPGTVKLPLVQSRPPAVIGQPVASSVVPKIAVIALALFFSGLAHAQVLSAGASVPMLEFTNKSGQPVSVAPGAGVEGAIGFFQRSLLGEQWDLLDFSAQLFGTSPGALQVAALVGTLNNIIGIGAAIPLVAADGSGAFQGAFHVYPVLSLSIPIAFGPYSPPVGIEPGALGLRRGGTVYLPIP